MPLRRSRTTTVISFQGGKKLGKLPLSSSCHIIIPGLLAVEAAAGEQTSKPIRVHRPRHPGSGAVRTNSILRVTTSSTSEYVGIIIVLCNT